MKGTLLKSLTEHTGEVWSVDVTRDARWALSSATDNKVYLWDLEAGKAKKVFSVPPCSTFGAQGVTFSPDGKRAAWGIGDRTIQLWNVAEGSVEKTLTGLPADWVRSLRFSPDGRRLLAGGQDIGFLALYDIGTGRLIDSVRTPNVASVAFTPDGLRAVVAHQDAKARVWRLPRGDAGK